MNTLFQNNNKPFFPLGGQVNNSSAGDPATMEHCFRTARTCGMNSIAAPVYWEMLEPEEGSFSFSQVDMLIDGARRHGLKLILLWFGTWKNGNSHYIPTWMKRDHARFQHVRSADGTPVTCISALCKNSLEKDCLAFTTLCKHIAQNNADETVIGIQVENEPGIIGAPRDHSEHANQLFAQAIPEALAKVAKHSGTWKEVFGFDADEIFTAYYTAVYIDQVASAGKQELSLPMYINVWIGEMHNRVAGIDYPSGGAVSRLLWLYQAFAPHLDGISPDIYLQDTEIVMDIHRAYAKQPHYYIPELLPSALSGTNAIRAVTQCGLTGIHYFLLDLFCDPVGNITPRFAEAIHALHAVKHMLPMVERYAGTPQLQAVCQYECRSEQYFDFGDYTATVRFLNPMGDVMAANSPTTMDNRHFASPDNSPRGKGLICYDKKGTFYLTGEGYRLMLYPKTSIQAAANASHSADFLNQRNQPFLSVDEGYFDDNGEFCPVRHRNGDEADYGFWVTDDIQVLRVVMDLDFFR